MTRTAKEAKALIRDAEKAGLTVETKTTPKTPAKTAPKAAAKPKQQPVTAPALPGVADPLTMLTAVAQRVSDAETRADEAEFMVATLEEELERIRGERDAYRAQVEQINNAFQMLAGGGK